MVAATAQSALEQIFDSLSDCLTAEVAQRIVDVELSPAVKSRIDELAIKANRGTLTSDERKQYEQFVEAIDLLAFFQAKARLMLTRQLH